MSSLQNNYSHPASATSKKFNLTISNTDTYTNSSRITLHGKTYEITVLDEHDQKLRLPRKIFAQIRETLSEKPPEISTKTYTFVEASTKDPKITKIFQTISQSKKPLVKSSSNKNPEKASTIEFSRTETSTPNEPKFIFPKRGIKQLNGNQTATLNEPKPIFPKRTVKGIYRLNGNQTCWAIAVLESFVFKDEVLRKEIEKLKNPQGKLLALQKIYQIYDQAAGPVDLTKHIQTLFEGFGGVAEESSRENILSVRFSSANMTKDLFNYLRGIGIKTALSPITTRKIKTRLVLDEEGNPKKDAEGNPLTAEVLENEEQQELVQALPVAREVEEIPMQTLINRLRIVKGRPLGEHIGFEVERRVVIPAENPKYNPEKSISKENDRWLRDHSGNVVSFPTVRIYKVKTSEEIVLDKTRYELVSFTTNLSGIHYVSYVKEGSKWYEINDDRVREIPSGLIKRIAEQAATFTYKKAAQS